jgi:hypothetical protein
VEEVKEFGFIAAGFDDAVRYVDREQENSSYGSNGQVDVET